MRKALPSWLVFAAALSLCHPSLNAQKQFDYCNRIATIVLSRPELTSTNVADITNNPSCLFQVSLSDAAANAAIAPARVSLWNALDGLSGSQQQGSSVASSGSTNTVSKPSGPTALVEEFGGANTTTGASSFTVQWAPGTMFTNLALTGGSYLCLTKDQPKGCISSSLLKNLTPLTIKLTANTSGSQTVAGAGTGTSTTSTSQPVTVSSKGNGGPGFGGLTVQYSIFGSRNKAAVSSMTSQDKSSPGQSGAKPTTAPAAVQYFKTELSALNTTSDGLSKCQDYAEWQSLATARLSSTIADLNQKQMSPGDKASALQEAIEDEYKKLLTDMLKFPSCRAALDAFKAFYAAILEARTYEDFAAVQQSQGKPELALEYDLNTPQNKPSYSTAKATGNWQFGKVATAPSAAKPDSHPAVTPKQQLAHNYAASQVDTLAAVNPANPSSTGKQLTANAKPLAQATALPWSLTVTGAAEIYNAEPPSSVPSGSHLRDLQAGAEISYLFSPSNGASTIRKLIGPLTAAAAYSYQDQTSPAMLTGPALSGFSGLPSSTTTAYAKRGVIHLGQVKFGLGAGSNTTFPLAFTYSNRTELVVHPTWALQFGVSYNMTSLFNSSGAAKPASSAGGN
jgi:hypothetical protein